MMSDSLVINEIYVSLQGESTFAGLPCIFVRLTACNLRCSYCDTAYAFTEGRQMSLIDIRAEVHKLAQPFSQPSAFRSAGEMPAPLSRLPLVELTGGEPLVHSGAVLPTK